jgi:hypothetical protein
MVFYVCNRSKESSRNQKGERKERLVRQVNSVKLPYNCLAYVSAVMHKYGSVDVEYLDFHTCRHQGEDFKLRLSRAVLADIDAQVA